MSLVKTTELSAVNIMLSAIGESPINSLSDIEEVVDAVTARSILQEVAVQVQSEGWHFNTERNFKLFPNTNGYIVLPENCLQVDTVGESQTIDVSLRGGKLYNNDTHSLSFDKPLVVDMIVLLAFEELPQAARYYITLRAARIFQQRVVGSKTLFAINEKDEQRARIALSRYQSETADFNILKDSYSVSNILRR